MNNFESIFLSNQNQRREIKSIINEQTSNTKIQSQIFLFYSKIENKYTIIIYYFLFILKTLFKKLRLPIRIKARPEESVLTLKQRVKQQRGITIDDQILSYKGMELENKKPIGYYLSQQNSIVVLKPKQQLQQYTTHSILKDLLFIMDKLIEKYQKISQNIILIATQIKNDDLKINQFKEITTNFILDLKEFISPQVQQNVPPPTIQSSKRSYIKQKYKYTLNDSPMSLQNKFIFK
ncbi:hypothetical protein pb186bvf_020388 [Paramecium bursaria]